MVNVDKIKKLAELQGIKLTRVCETIGRKVYYLNDVKRHGGSMPQEYIDKIAALLSTTSEYLCDETDDPEIPPKSGTRRVRRIPVFGNVAAGVPIDAITDIEDYEEMWDDDASKYGELFALRIKGDSMEPKISNGDIVIVRAQPDVDNGETAIVCINGAQATCKKIQKTPEGLMLLSTNPKYDPMFYTWRQVEELPITVLGKVVELRAKF
jgi:repressor LexA